MKKQLIQAIDSEKIRTLLANKRKYKKLFETYGVMPEIKNINTNSLWNKLNKSSLLLSSSKVFKHKLNIAFEQISKGNQKILNIGVGAGFLEKKVFNKDKFNQIDWFGIDISVQSINKMRLLYPKAHFQVGNVNSLNYENNFFDTIFMLDILEHISPSNTFNVLNEVKRVLKSNGKLILSVPLNEGLDKMLLRGINPNAHVRIYTKELIFAELNIAEFVVIKNKELYAFKTNYIIKNFIVSKLKFFNKNPNLIVIIARKK